MNQKGAEKRIRDLGENDTGKKGKIRKKRQEDTRSGRDIVLERERVNISLKREKRPFRRHMKWRFV